MGVVEIPGAWQEKTEGNAPDGRLLGSTSASTSSAGTTAPTTTSTRPPRAWNEEIVKEISHRKSELRLDDEVPAQLARPLRERKPMPRSGSTNMPDIDWDDIYYYLKPTAKGGQVNDWDNAPGRHEGHVREVWASPRPSASTSPGSPHTLSACASDVGVDHRRHAA